MLAQKRIQGNPCESKENNSPSFSGSLSFSYCLNNTYDSPAKHFQVIWSYSCLFKALNIFFKKTRLCLLILLLYLLCPFLILSLNFHNDFKFLTRGSLKLFIGLYHHWNYKAVQSTKMRQKKKLYKEHTWYRIVEHLNKVTGLNRKLSAQIRD